MKVKDVMTTDVRTCRLDTNLAAATEVMWNSDCGILPVVDEAGRAVGVITDRDMCIALGTRCAAPQEITVGQVISGNLFVCRPESEIRDALVVMSDKRVRRLVALDDQGRVAGLLSLDDIAVAAESPTGFRRPDLSFSDVALTLKAICRRPLIETPATERVVATGA